MSVVTYITIASGLGLIISSVIFRLERSRGERLFLANFRQRVDILVEAGTYSFLGVKKVFGASSFRLFLHYLLHQVLGLVLYIIRFLEKHLYRWRARNKVVAKDIRSQAVENHLFHIARHKESVALSEEDRERLRHRSLHD